MTQSSINIFTLSLTKQQNSANSEELHCFLVTHLARNQICHVWILYKNKNIKFFYVNDICCK